jgi:hypothetical protein
MPNVRRLRSTPSGPRVLVTATVAAVLGGALVGLSGAGAKGSAAGGQIHACVANRGGAVRFVSARAKCAKGEHGVVFNQAGAQGPRGKLGKTGPAGVAGPTGAVGPTGPAGPANTEIVDGPTVTLNGSEATGTTVTSTAGCDHATIGGNTEAYGGGMIVTTHPTTSTPDRVATQSSYPGTGVTGTTAANPVTTPGARGDSWTGTAVIIALPSNGDTATAQAYVICGP